MPQADDETSPLWEGRGELEGDGLYIVVVGEAAAEEMARKLGEN